nr:MAG TPA: hypothetical protein [Caudoviricetes sp.]
MGGGCSLPHPACTHTDFLSAQCDLLDCTKCF